MHNIFGVAFLYTHILEFLQIHLYQFSNVHIFINEFLHMHTLTKGCDQHGTRTQHFCRRPFKHPHLYKFLHANMCICINFHMRTNTHMNGYKHIHICKRTHTHTQWIWSTWDTRATFLPWTFWTPTFVYIFLHAHSTLLQLYKFSYRAHMYMNFVKHMNLCTHTRTHTHECN